MKVIITGGAGFIGSHIATALVERGDRVHSIMVNDRESPWQFAAEHIENPIMTDHHVHTDLGPAIEAAGMESFVTATIGEEITSFDYGHFNGYPFTIDPSLLPGNFMNSGSQGNDPAALKANEYDGYLLLSAHNGDKAALDVKTGDKVLFGKFAGTEVKIDGDDLLVMREDDIFAVVE